MRRTAVLLALFALGAALVATIEVPRRRTGAELARGPRVLRTPAHRIRRLDVGTSARRLLAERTGAGWQIDGPRASPRAADALEDLAGLLAALRAVDAFHVADAAGFGFDRPTATVDVTTPDHRTRLVLGALNAT